jgi:tyrosinase
MIIRRSNIAFDRWTDFRHAIEQMIATGEYERLVRIHNEMRRDADGFGFSRRRMHGTMSRPLGVRRFLPWHRAYLIVFERALRAIDSTLSVPYWDWNDDGGRLVGVRTFLGLSSGRDLGAPAGAPPGPGQQPWFTSETEVASIVGFGGDYFTMSDFLETNPHNLGHAWVAGDMNSMSSPRDPVFWMHHAQIDRIWSVWQSTNPGERATLSGQEARMDPWGAEFDVDNIDDISNLGADSYSYEAPPGGGQ